MSLRKIRHAGLRDLYNGDSTRRIDKRFQLKLKEMLDMLDAATGPQDLKGAAGFHPLKGDRAGEYAMTVTRNYRLTFRFENRNVTDVDFEDYH
ncbi:MAG: plasmid maintenance system killer protein [Alphaproteobacteria bacterium]|nr:plasmid maintenance system killer protein [Alphaproteobacteria bacterium]